MQTFVHYAYTISLRKGGTLHRDVPDICPGRLRGTSRHEGLSFCDFWFLNFQIFRARLSGPGERAKCRALSFFEVFAIFSPVAFLLRQSLQVTHGTKLSQEPPIVKEHN